MAQLVERHLAKVETAGSSPVYRFFVTEASGKRVSVFFMYKSPADGSLYRNVFAKQCRI